MVFKGERRRGLVIGCGGTLGAAWIVAALASVRDVLGWDPREADVLMGTSAGAEYVTMLGSGIGVDELLDLQRGTATNPVLAAHLAAGPGMLPPIPQPRIGSLRLALQAQGMRSAAALLPIGRGDATWLGTLAQQLNPGRDWVPHPATWLVAMDLATGEQVPFGAPHAPAATLSEALRASWAVPGWFPPVHIGGRRYVDGGAASTCSADLVAPLRLDEVIVLAPMASTGRMPARGLDRLERLALRNWMSDGLDHEIAALEATGAKVLRVDASAADLAVMGPNFMDPRRRQATFAHALHTTRTMIETRARESEFA